MARYIAVEGVIGSGKSTLAAALARLTGARTFQEPVDANPFLSRCYAGEPGMALPMQLQFLLSRFAQQLDVQDHCARGGLAVSDYAFDKELVFAPILLKARQDAELHSQAFAAMRPRVNAPDVLVFLKVPVEECRAGIAERGRAMELGIDLTFLSSLAASYAQWLSMYRDQVIVIERERLRPTGPDAEHLARELLQRLGIPEEP